MVVARTIRMKEMRPGTDVMKEPTPAYLALSDGSIGRGPYRVRADDNGFIITGNEVDPQLPAIAFLGDSFVESMFAHESERFVSLVERQLEIDGQRFQCLNGGYSGSTALQLLTLLLNKIYPALGPHGIVVWFGTHSDADSLFGDGAYWNNNRVSANILSNAIPGNPAIPGGNQAHAAVLRSAIHVARTFKIRLLLATTPHRIADFETDHVLRSKFKNDRARFELTSSRRASYNETIREVAADTGVGVLDCAKSLDGDPAYFYDELHLNGLGQAVCGRALTLMLQKEIKRRNWHQTPGDGGPSSSEGFAELPTSEKLLQADLTRISGSGQQ